MTCLKSLNAGIILTCAVGIGLSYYAYFVETKKEEDPNYEAMCDISEHMSCSKVFMSEYGKGFGLVGKVLGKESTLNRPNGLGGMVFYPIVAALSFLNSLPASKLQIALCIVSNILSVYLGYVLIFVLSDFCVVCVSTYVVNFIALWLAISRHRHLASSLAAVSGKKSSQKKKKAH